LHWCKTRHHKSSADSCRSRPAAVGRKYALAVYFGTGNDKAKGNLYKFRLDQERDCQRFVRLQTAGFGGIRISHRGDDWTAGRPEVIDAATGAQLDALSAEKSAP